MLGTLDTSINETCSLLQRIYTVIVETYLQRTIILVKGRCVDVMNLYFVGSVLLDLCFSEFSSLCSSRLAWATRTVLGKFWKTEKWNSHILITLRGLEQHKGCCDISHMWLHICWLTWWWGWQRQLNSQQLQLLLQPPLASLDAPQASWQNSAVSPTADTYSIKFGDLKVAKDKNTGSNSSSWAQLRSQLVLPHLPFPTASPEGRHDNLPQSVSPTSFHNSVQSNLYNNSYPNCSARGYQEMFCNQVTFQLRVFKDEEEFHSTESRRKALQTWRIAHTKAWRHSRTSYIQDRVTIMFVGESPGRQKGKGGWGRW